MAMHAAVGKQTIMVLGRGTTATDAVQAIRDSYEAGKTDEFVLPTVIAL